MLTLERSVLGIPLPPTRLITCDRCGHDQVTGRDLGNIVRSALCAVFVLGVIFTIAIPGYGLVFSVLPLSLGLVLVSAKVYSDARTGMVVNNVESRRRHRS